MKVDKQNGYGFPYTLLYVKDVGPLLVDLVEDKHVLDEQRHHWHHRQADHEYHVRLKHYIQKYLKYAHVISMFYVIGNFGTCLATCTLLYATYCIGFKIRGNILDLKPYTRFVIEIT